VAARTTGHRRRRWGHTGTTCLCISPRSGGEAGGARTAAGDGELVREEAAGEEALWPEAIAISSGLKLVLDEEEVTAEQIPDSDGDGEGWQWLVMASRGGRPRAERSGARCAREGRKVEEELLLFPHAIRPLAQVGRRSPAATGTSATTAWRVRSSVVTGKWCMRAGPGNWVPGLKRV
jgi:hypothetical protein